TMRHKLTYVYNGIRSTKHRPENLAALKQDGFIGEVGEDLMAWSDQNKLALQDKLGLDTTNPNNIIVGMVTRIVKQKGLNVLFAPCHAGGLSLIEQLLQIKDETTGGRVQVVILGTGDQSVVDGLNAIAAKSEYRGRFSFVNKFDPILAKQIGAGSHIALMPSIDEPGGLANQELALLLSILIVTGRGGLNDFYNMGGTPVAPVPGFEFADDPDSVREQMRSANEIYQRTQELFHTYVHDKAKFNEYLTQVRAFNPDWGERVDAYAKAYRESIEGVEIEEPIRAPSVNTRLEKARPTERNIRKAFKGIDLSEFDIIDSGLIGQGRSALADRDGHQAARLLEELESNRRIRAPTRDLLESNVNLREIFESVYSLVYFDQAGQLWILVSPDVLEPGHAEAIPTLTLAAEAGYWRLQGDDIYLAHLEPEQPELRSQKISAFLDAWKVLTEERLLANANILSLLSNSSGSDRTKVLAQALSEGIGQPRFKRRFITVQMNTSGSTEFAEVVESGRRAVRNWEYIEEKIASFKFSDVYFEDNYISIYYHLGRDHVIARIAPDYFVDYLTDTPKVRSFIGGRLRSDVIIDSKEADEMQAELQVYRTYPELRQIVSDLNSDDWNENIRALRRLDNILRSTRTDSALREEAKRLLTAALGKENAALVQKEAQKILNYLYSGRPREFPQAQKVMVARLGEEFIVDDLIIPVGFNPLRQRSKLSNFQAQLLVATNWQKGVQKHQLEVVAENDHAVRLTVPSLETTHGILHLTVQIKKSGHGRWIYSREPNANITIYCQKDLRGQMIYQAWPAYLGIYGDDGQVRRDAAGRAIPGDFKTIEKMLPSLKKQGYRYLLIMGVYQLDKPENIPGQVGPDASIFSPLRFSISKELGGEEEFRRLIKKAKGEFDIEVLVDIIPHVNQNFSEWPEWAIVKVRTGDAAPIHRRIATDGSVNHEDGSPVEWHDSAMINWRDKRVLDAYLDLIKRMADMGVKGTRIDVAHKLGTMLPVDKVAQGREKLFGYITTWERDVDGSFKVVNQWDNEQPNPYLVYLVSEITKMKEHSDFIFIGENYWKYNQLIRSGVIPMDSGTHDELEKTILKGESTQGDLNAHFRRLFSDLPKGAQVISAIETHDYNRLMDRWKSYGPYRLKAPVWIWLATTRGAILVYNRQELGEVHRTRIDSFTRHDYDEADRQRYYAQLDFERANHGETVQVFYERALRFYRENSAIHSEGDYIIDTGNDRVFAIARFNENENLIVIVNCGGEQGAFSIDLAPLGERLGIQASESKVYLLKDYESQREERLTGKQLITNRLQVQLGPYRAAIISIEEFVQGAAICLAEGTPTQEEIRSAQAIAESIITTRGASRLLSNGNYTRPKLGHSPQNLYEEFKHSIKPHLARQGSDITFVLISGYREALRKTNNPRIANMAMVCLGRGDERVVFMDENDYLYIRSIGDLLPLGHWHDAIVEGLNHEICHLDNPGESEWKVESERPTSRIQHILGFLKRYNFDPAETKGLQDRYK
ncbi:MAG: alpha-amylase family glycosyl hydrolase, partial [Planctomycetota bacterium]